MKRNGDKLKSVESDIYNVDEEMFNTKITLNKWQ